jgi:hypothetical protein
MCRSINVSKEYLEEHYIKLKESSRKIANELGCSSKTILRKLIEYGIKVRTVGSERKDLVGKKFGRLLVLKFSHKSRCGKTVWLVVCDCGVEKKVSGNDLVCGSIGSCGCLRRGCGRKYYMEISGSFFSKIKNGARIRNLEFTITKEYIWDLFIKQNRRCYFSGFELSFPGGRGDSVYTASLDRIDNTKGYIEGNVRWVHKRINIMRSVLDDSEFIKICKSITKNQERLETIDVIEKCRDISCVY